MVNTNQIIRMALAVMLALISSPAWLAQVTYGRTQDQVLVPQMTEEQIGAKSYAVVRSVVKASPDLVWQILTNYSIQTSIFHNLKKCQVLTDKGSVKVIHHQVHPSGVPNTFDYDIEIHEVARKSMEWHRLGGDFREVEGFWKLEPVEGGRSTLVTYASYINGGFFIPQVLIKRQARIDMPAVMLALKDHAEYQMQIASRRSDTH